MEAEMKKIPLTQGKFAIVDDEDYEKLASHKWMYANGYAIRQTRRGKLKNIWMHRVVNNTPDGYITDHANRNKLDNRKANLRTATRQENNRNKGPQTNNKANCKGVFYDKSCKRIRRWKAQIYIKKQQVHLGYFLTKEEAAEAYTKASTYYFKEFSHVQIAK